MKILLISSVFIFSIVESSRAQGTVQFNNHIIGQVVTHVYGPQSDGYALTGNGSNDTPAGTTVYTGVPLGGTNAGPYAGQTWTAQLWGLAGTGQSAAYLEVLTQYTTTFRTSAGGGGFIIPPNPLPDPGIPNTSANGDSATLQLRVWDNFGGTVTRWVDALAVSPHGSSPTFELTGLSTGPSPLIGLQSFNVVGDSVPEPGTIVLIAMGLGCFGFKRREK